ncbi:hypothetical protein F0M17_17295 (plasmid) [Glutamicibacter sp. ZJUTW]|nr:hypothetical protein F0M17_17295 [Glutamicibacter sp. ZJUTW]
MDSSLSIWESCNQSQDHTGRLQKPVAAASAASSPGRRDQTSPQAQKPWHHFTHQGKPYRLVRMLPGDYPGESIQPHQTATAKVYTLSGTVQVQARATARTPHLVHVIWEDEKGETFGTWLPRLSVKFDSLPPSTNE